MKPTKLQVETAEGSGIYADVGSMHTWHCGDARHATRELYPTALAAQLAYAWHARTCEYVQGEIAKYEARRRGLASSRFGRWWNRAAIADLDRAITHLQGGTA